MSSFVVLVYRSDFKLSLYVVLHPFTAYFFFLSSDYNIEKPWENRVLYDTDGLLRFIINFLSSKRIVI